MDTSKLKPVAILNNKDRTEILKQCGKKWKSVVEKLIQHGNRKYSIGSMTHELHTANMIPDTNDFHVVNTVVNGLNTMLTNKGSRFAIRRDVKAGMMWIGIKNR